MRTSPLGTTGIEITEFVFGAGSIGGVGSSPATRGLGITVEQGLDRLDEAYDLGIRVVDTADGYAGGESERTVGQWLARRRPDGVFVQTKVGGVHQDGKSRIDLSGPHVARQLAQSIERLGRVDVYLSHAPDPGTPVEETLTAFAAALEAGRIRAYGVCNVGVRLVERILGTAALRGLPRPAVVQNRLNLLSREDEDDLLPLLTAESIGFEAFSPLAGGVLSDRYVDGQAPAPGSRIAVAGEKYYAGMYTEANVARVTRLRDVARERGISVAGLALAWLRANPSVTAPVVAPSTEAQWQAVREALATDLTFDEFGQVGAIFDG
jgi:aryl-alcohol dehydrogenase-like predicted oxidoreductase